MSSLGAPVVTLPPFFVFEPLQQYPKCFDDGHSRPMGNDGNELQVRDCLGECCDMTVAGWAKRWNQWGSRGALFCRFAGKETDSSFVRARKEVEYERLQLPLLAWMCEQEDGPAGMPTLEYFVASLRFHGL